VKLIERQIVSGEGDGHCEALPTEDVPILAERCRDIFAAIFGFAVFPQMTWWFRGREEYVVCVAEDFVAETDHTVLGFGDARPNAEQLVVPRRMMIAHFTSATTICSRLLLHAFVFDASARISSTRPTSNQIK